MFELDRLKGSTYPGRGIVIGLTPNGEHFTQIYWIMGRSSSSRNRVFLHEGSAVVTAPVDKSQEVDPLTLYYPVKVIGDRHIVTNGDQTDTILESLEQGGSFESALETRTFEPDGPIFTPRISGITDLDDSYAYKLSVLKTVDHNPEFGVRQYFSYEAGIRGVGHCITTYLDDGDPPPSFSGEPFCVKLFDDLDQNLESFWEILNQANKVSMLVKFIHAQSGESHLRIINQYE